MCCTDGTDVSVLSGIELRSKSSLQRCVQQQHQPAFVPSPYLSTSQQPGLFPPAFGGSSFSRSSASSTEGSHFVTGGNVSHVPQSILKQSTVSRHCDGTADSSVHTAVPLLAQDAQSSISTGSTSISAATLQSTMPVGADLNEYITSMLKGKPVAGVHQNVTPVRKSSLVCPRSGPSPSADVTRSTSLRQPTRSDANEWLPVRHAVANAQLNYPVPVSYTHLTLPTILRV